MIKKWIFIAGVYASQENWRASIEIPGVLQSEYGDGGATDIGHRSELAFGATGRGSDVCELSDEMVAAIEEHGVEKYITFFASILMLTSALRLTMYITKEIVPMTMLYFVIGIILYGVSNAATFTFPLVHTLANATVDTSLMDHRILFMVIIPVCLYNSVMHVNTHVFRRSLPPMLALALPGVAVNMVLVAIFFYALMGVHNIPACLLIGSILSATDPVAVVANLTTLKAPAHLITIIEGESLLNDGSSVVFFEIAKIFLTGAGATTLEVITISLRLALVGCVIGLIGGVLMYHWTKTIRSALYSQCIVVIVMVYFLYVIAETVFHTSGILTVVAYATYMAGWGRCGMSPQADAVHMHVVGVMSEIATDALFMCAGVIAARMMSGIVVSWSMCVAVLVMYVFLMLARAAVIFIFAPVLYRTGYGLKWKELVVCIWGGLRGGVALALVLMLETDEDIDHSLKGLIAFCVSTFTLLTLVINGTTLKRVYTLLHLYPVTSFHRHYFHEVLCDLEQQFETKMVALTNHWLFRISPVVLDVSGRATLDLGRVTMNDVGEVAPGPQISHWGQLTPPDNADWQPIDGTEHIQVPPPLMEDARAGSRNGSRAYSWVSYVSSFFTGSSGSFTGSSSGSSSYSVSRSGSYTNTYTSPYSPRSKDSKGSKDMIDLESFKPENMPMLPQRKRRRASLREGVKFFNEASLRMTASGEPPASSRVHMVEIILNLTEIMYSDFVREGWLSRESFKRLKQSIEHAKDANQLDDSNLDMSALAKEWDVVQRGVCRPRSMCPYSTTYRKLQKFIRDVEAIVAFIEAKRLLVAELGMETLIQTCGITVAQSLSDNDHRCLTLLQQRRTVSEPWFRLAVVRICALQMSGAKTSLVNSAANSGGLLDGDRQKVVKLLEEQTSKIKGMEVW